MRRWIAMSLMAVTALGSRAAFAADTGAEGYGALALGGIVGSYSPALTAGQKTVLAKLLSANPSSAARAADVTVIADEVHCRAGDVVITAFACDLRFGSVTRHLAGRAANELFATLGDAGVQDDGAAGTMHRVITKLSCTISPRLIGAGGGARCSYKID